MKVQGSQFNECKCKCKTGRERRRLLAVSSKCHCEEQSDVAISSLFVMLNLFQHLSLTLTLSDWHSNRVQELESDEKK